MKKNGTRFAAFLICLVMVLQVFAVSAFAEEALDERVMPEMTELEFGDGTTETAWAVYPFNYVDSWDAVGGWSKDRINFGSNRSTYYKLNGKIADCYGMGVAVRLTEKKNISDDQQFKIGLLNNKKGDYGDYHLAAALKLDEVGVLTCYNRTPGTFNGFMTMTERPLNKKASYNYSYTNLVLYFGSVEAATEYIDSIAPANA